jgi:hypothetical protein
MDSQLLARILIFTALLGSCILMFLILREQLNKKVKKGIIVNVEKLSDEGLKQLKKDIETELTLRMKDGLYKTG